jgi:hypothetical protein
VTARRASRREDPLDRDEKATFWWIVGRLTREADRDADLAQVVGLSASAVSSATSVRPCLAIPTDAAATPGRVVHAVADHRRLP